MNMRRLQCAFQLIAANGAQSARAPEQRLGLDDHFGTRSCGNDVPGLVLIVSAPLTNKEPGDKLKIWGELRRSRPRSTAFLQKNTGASSNGFGFANKGDGMTS